MRVFILHLALLGAVLAVPISTNRPDQNAESAQIAARNSQAAAAHNPILVSGDSRSSARQAGDGHNNNDNDNDGSLSRRSLDDEGDEADNILVKRGLQLKKRLQRRRRRGRGGGEGQIRAGGLQAGGGAKQEAAKQQGAGQGKSARRRRQRQKQRQRKATEAKHRDKAEKYAAMNDEERDREENRRVAKKLKKMEGMTKDEQEKYIEKQKLKDKLESEAVSRTELHRNMPFADGLP